MPFHTIVLAVVALLSIPLFAAYWTAHRQSNQAHLDLLCKRDQNDPSADLKGWKRLELWRQAIGAGFLLLLLVWGAVQVYLGDAKTTMDWVFTWAFAPSFVGLVLVSEHLNTEDLLNSMGLGQRAERRYSAAV